MNEVIRKSNGQFAKTAKDLTGQRFTKLSVIQYDHKGTHNHYYKCLCDCGKETIARADHLRNGGVKSCGCYLFENKANLKHGLNKHLLYHIWVKMRQRCNDANSAAYKYYGAQGVKVDSRWDNFQDFHDWALSNNWRKRLHICRKGDIGDYSPDNCYIATALQNNRDRKSNKLNLMRVSVMKTLRKHGFTFQRIADLYGVQVKTAENAIKGKIWAN